MKMTNAKKAADVKLDGVKVEMVMKDHNLLRVIFRDTLGNYVEVAKDGYSDLACLVLAPPEKKKVFQLIGKVIDLPITENFDSKYEAETRKEKLEIKDSEAVLSIQEVEVEVN